MVVPFIVVGGTSPPEGYATAAEAAELTPNWDRPFASVTPERLSQPVSTAEPLAIEPADVTSFVRKPVYAGPAPASRAPPLPAAPMPKPAVYGTYGAKPPTFAVHLPPPMYIKVELAEDVPAGVVTPTV